MKYTNHLYKKNTDLIVNLGHVFFFFRYVSSKYGRVNNKLLNGRNNMRTPRQSVVKTCRPVP